MEILNELISKQIEFQKTLESMNKKFDDQAQKKPVVHLDHQAIASQIRAGLPSPEQFQKANDQMNEAISRIPKKIYVDTPNDILGFINIKSLLVHYGALFFIFLILLSTIVYSKNQEIDALIADRRQQRNFESWIQEKYPKVWEVWERE